MYLISIILVFLIYAIINFLNKYVNYICYQLKIFNEKLLRNRY